MQVIIRNFVEIGLILKNQKQKTKWLPNET